MAGITSYSQDLQLRCFQEHLQRKRLFIKLLRVFHNGLVKGASKKNPETIFGKTVNTTNGKAVVDLEENLIEVDSARLNRPFRSWVASLKYWNKRGEIKFNRLAFGNNEAFDFLKEEEIDVEVLDPIEETVKVNGKDTPALPLLHNPPKDDNIAVDGFNPDGK